MKTSFIILLINIFFISCGYDEDTGLYYMDGYPNKVKCDSERSLISLTNPNGAFNEDYCRSLKIDSGTFRCCYIHAKDPDGKHYRGCAPLSYNEYAVADDLVPANFSLPDNFTDLEIHCNSKYFTVAASLIALVFALF